MKKYFLTGLLVTFVLVQAGASVKLDEFLNRKEVKEIRVLESESIFERILEIMIEQPIDHRNPNGETFNQRLYISHIDPDRPVVLVTAGYDARYYYTSEIAQELKCNQIMVEHRYFGRSEPDDPSWEYLDTWQAASDHHRIIGIQKRRSILRWGLAICRSISHHSIPRMATWQANSKSIISNRPWPSGG